MPSILAFQAHPDDVETLAAGTLALLARSGHHIVIATATAGECGSTAHDLAATAAIRQREAANAASLIGADYRCAGLPDLGVFNDDASRRKVTELIRWAHADIVITASPVDYHPDHETTSLLVRDACFAAPVPNYRTGESAPLDAIPHLYFMDPVGGRDREGTWVEPAFAVEVGAFMDTKRRMLEAHQSQVEWVAKQHGITDFTASMVDWSRRRGRDFGVEFAEGFRQYRHHPYPTTPLLQELVGPSLLSPRASA